MKRIILHRARQFTSLKLRTWNTVKTKRGTLNTTLFLLYSNDFTTAIVFKPNIITNFITCSSVLLLTMIIIIIKTYSEVLHTFKTICYCFSSLILLFDGVCCLLLFVMNSGKVFLSSSVKIAANYNGLLFNVSRLFLLLPEYLH